MKETPKKYNLKVRKKSVDAKQIDKHQDFEKVYKGYSSWVYRNPWYKTQLHAPKNKKTFMSLILIIIIAYLVYEAIEEEEKMEKDLRQTEQVDPAKN